MQEGKKIEINYLKVGIVAFVILALGLLIYSLYEIFRPNPYGEEIKINNFSDYFGDAPRDSRDRLFSALHGIVESNAEQNDLENIPKSGAMIRDRGVSNTYNEEENLHVGDFIVDIESIRQSYLGHFEWSDDLENVYFSGYTILYTCLDKDYLIYGDFKCQDMFSENVVTKFPIARYLPYKVEYYSDNYANYTKYELFYEVNEDKTELTIKIVDSTGGNYQEALKTLQSFGYDIKDFKIEYIDESEQYSWPKAE